MADTTKYGSTTGEIPDRITWLSGIVIGILIAFAVGFIAIFISAVAIFHDAYTNKASTYRELEREVHETNHKIDTLLENIPVSTSSSQTQLQNFTKN